MATYIENLTTRKEAIATELAALTSTAAGGKPDGGKSGVGHVAYKDALYRELEMIEKLLDKANINSGSADSTLVDILSIGET